MFLDMEEIFLFTYFTFLVEQNVSVVQMENKSKQIIPDFRNILCSYATFKNIKRLITHPLKLTKAFEIL